MSTKQIAREAQEEIRTCNWFSEDTCWASDGPIADRVTEIIEKAIQAALNAPTKTVASEHKAATPRKEKHKDGCEIYLTADPSFCTCGAEATLTEKGVQ